MDALVIGFLIDLVVGAVNIAATLWLGIVVLLCVGVYLFFRLYWIQYGTNPSNRPTAARSDAGKHSDGDTGEGFIPAIPSEAYQPEPQAVADIFAKHPGIKEILRRSSRASQLHLYDDPDKPVGSEP